MMIQETKMGIKDDVEYLMKQSHGNSIPADDRDSYIFELRATCYCLLDSTAQLIAHLLDSTPFDGKRYMAMELMANELVEIRDTHFGEFNEIEEMIEEARQAEKEDEAAEDDE
jgi:hypothetical protein